MQWITFDHEIQGSPIGFRTWIYDDETVAVNPDDLMLEWAVDVPQHLGEILEAQGDESWKESEDARAE